MHIKFPNSLTEDDFLRHYWQKHPLLMRQAVAGFEFSLSPEELAGLACETEVESRLVIQHSRQHWALRHGPFKEQDFLQLPDENWTLLVQDVDKWFPPAARLLRAFDFIPSWRFDDVMVSYAPPGGSVGPHIDSYDVFLIQARGSREWRINTQVNNPQLLPDLPLRILAEFEADQSWVLQAGDILYLPPGVAHWGIANDDCMTWSVGLRAPTTAEMLDAYTQFLLEHIDANEHYHDPPLNAQSSPALIDPAVFEAVRTQLDRWLGNKPLQQRWFGCFSTELKPHQIISPATKSERQPGQQLVRHPHARLAWAKINQQPYLFVCGEEYPLPFDCSEFAALLCDHPRLDASQLQVWLDNQATADLLEQLLESGYLVWSHE